LQFSDTDTGNPLVSELQEDFEPEETSMSKPVKVVKKDTYNSAARVGKPDGISNLFEVVVQLQLLWLENNFTVLQLDQAVPEDLDSTINSEISELTSDGYVGYVDWESCWRHSPEGTIC